MGQAMDRMLSRAGRTHVSAALTKEAGKAETTHALAGQLYLSSSGWVLLDVPNALVRGAFDALQEPGAELPPTSHKAGLNAHITVMRPEEVEQAGGADKVTERGHQFHYTLGPVKSVTPKGWSDMSKCWFVEVSSPELKTLRKSYGLSPLPNGDHPFHITIGVRRKKVLHDGDITKSGAEVVRPKRYMPGPLTAATLGRVGALPAALMLKPTKPWRHLAGPDPARVRDEVKRMEHAYPKELDDLKVRLGGTDTWDDLKRIVRSKRTGPVGKLRGLLSLPIANAMANVTRADHYNTATNAATVYSGLPGIAGHEAGHAVDFNRKSPYARDLYTLANIPEKAVMPLGGGPATLWWETQADRNVSKAQKGGPDEAARRANLWRTLAPAYGSYVGGTAGSLAALAGAPPLPALAGGVAAGVLGGHAAALLRNYIAGRHQHKHKTKKSSATSPLHLSTSAEVLYHKTAGDYGDGKLQEFKTWLNKEIKYEELDGIYLMANPVLRWALVDVMDWGDDKVGTRIENKLKKLFRHVIRQNEGGLPKGGGWVKIKHSAEKAAGLISVEEIRGLGRKAVRDEEIKRGLPLGALTAHDLLRDQYNDYKAANALTPLLLAGNLATDVVGLKAITSGSKKDKEPDPATKIEEDNSYLGQLRAKRKKRMNPVTAVKVAAGVLPIKGHKQETDYSCGPGSLKTVEDYYGKSKSESVLREETDADPDDGTPPEAIADQAQHDGLGAEVHEDVTMNDLKRQVDSGRPIIVNLQAPDSAHEGDDNGHYVTVTGYDDNYFYFKDPSLGDKTGKLTHDELLAHWHDERADGSKTDHLAVQVEGPASAYPSTPPRS